MAIASPFCNLPADWYKNKVRLSGLNNSAIATTLINRKQKPAPQFDSEYLLV